MNGPGPIRYTDHSITVARIDSDASKVLRRLHQFGYHGFLVGGSVRDLLLDREPKDFDVATSARPSEVRKLFRNCRLIGRRFRLAHILFGGGKIIETATFRAQPLETPEGGVLITDDNEFGTPESDAYRRDFTINALFYDPAENAVIDYCGGLADLDARMLRTIGDPVVRFREDPIRMLRAVKFAARLDFDIEEATEAAIISERYDLRKAAVPRLIEEIIRMLRGGAARVSFMMLADLGLLDILLPEVAGYIGRSVKDPWASIAPLLDALDEAQRKTMANGLLLATLYWPIFETLVRELGSKNGKQMRHLRPLAESIVAPAAVRLRIPRRDIGTLIAVMVGQRRLAYVARRRNGRAAFVHSNHYRAIAGFYRLRRAAGLVSDADRALWDPLLNEFPPPQHPPPRPPRDSRRRSGRRRRFDS